MKELIERSGGICELCGASSANEVFVVAPKKGDSAESCVQLCMTCASLADTMPAEAIDHWRCLNDSMWSEVPAVKVLVYRILSRYASAGWTTDLRDMMYLDDNLLEWAEAPGSGSSGHIDSNGNVLQSGDTVVLIKDLDVKGANFTAKRGTAVRNIRLVHDNPEHIEGRVNGQAIVILTQFVKKS